MSDTYKWKEGKNWWSFDLVVVQPNHEALKAGMILKTVAPPEDEDFTKGAWIMVDGKKHPIQADSFCYTSDLSVKELQELQNK